MVALVMLSNPKISVVVPCYNIAEYLPRCIESILNQTYRNLEIILISDGSTDNTDKVIKEYSLKDNRIIPVFKNNTGVSDTRNIGINMATGEYIGFVDGDDYIEPQMYEVLMKNALENNADISHCGYQMVFPSRVDYYYNTGEKVIQDNLKGLKDIIRGDYIEPGVWNKLYNKNILNNVFMDKSIRINEDVLFNFYAFVNSKKSVYEDIPFYHYILRKGSASTTKINDNKLFDPVKVRQEIFEYCYEHYNEEISSCAYSSYLYSLINMYRNIYKYDLSKKKNVAQKFKNHFKAIDIKYSLSRRNIIEKFLFLHCTGLHMFIYKVYDKFFSKNANKYEVK